VTRFDAATGVDNATALPTPPPQPKRTVYALHEPDNLTRQLPSRLQTLYLIVVGMVSARTVNLSHLACERPTTALVASTYRRLQRFFASAPTSRRRWVVGFLGLEGPWHLALDRTQWKLGTRDVNILMLAVVTRRAGVPLIWSVLDNDGGTSDSGQRIALMRRYLAIFGAASVRLLLADREFVGRAWMGFLNENSIPFAIRVKEKLLVTTEDGRRLPLGSLLRKCRGVRTFRAAFDDDPRCGTRAPSWLNFAAKRVLGKEPGAKVPGRLLERHAILLGELREPDVEQRPEHVPLDDRRGVAASRNPEGRHRLTGRFACGLAIAQTQGGAKPIDLLLEASASRVGIGLGPDLGNGITA